MTREQYERWKDFSVRMALRGFKNMTPARANSLAEEVQDFISNREDEFEKIESWDHGDIYICDYVSETFSHFEHVDKHGELREAKFITQIECCIRAGLDMAAEASAGVLGFDVGDLRRMYPEGFPDWLDNGDWPTPLKDLPDTAGVWLSGLRQWTN